MFGYIWYLVLVAEDTLNVNVCRCDKYVDLCTTSTLPSTDCSVLRILMGSIKNVSFSGEDSRIYFHFPSLLSVTFTIIRTCFQSHIHYRYKWHFTFHIQYQPITVKKCILCISVEKICFILTTGRSVCLSIESKFSSIFILSEMFNQCHHVICDHPAHRYETLESNVPKLHVSDKNTIVSAGSE